jgi:membrane-associated protease RseP (regulator of RpoE activity)
LNLIPVGQLDGGHVLYSLLGKWARYMYYPVMGALLLLSFFVAQELLFFAFLVLFLGSVHAVPLDDVTPLDPRRRWLSLLTLALFFVVFVPQPFNIITPSDSGPTPTNPTVWLALFFALLWTSRRRLFELLRRGR